MLGLKPDITILGKIIGGGMPLAAFGGRVDIMDCLAPLGSVYQAGTLSGNPIAVTAGLVNLNMISQAGFYEYISNMTELLTEGLTTAAKKNGVTFCANSIGGMFGLHFQEKLPINLAQVKCANQDNFKAFFHGMLRSGVFFAPSQYEAGFICHKHDVMVINKTIEIADKVFAILKK